MAKFEKNQCGIEAVKATYKPPMTVSVTVKNTGTCPVTVSLGREGASAERASGQSDPEDADPLILQATKVEQVLIACGSAVSENPKCSFEYKLTAG
jgi:hypothetical protein